MIFNIDRISKKEVPNSTKKRSTVFINPDDENLYLKTQDGEAILIQTNLKTINGELLSGEGNIILSSGNSPNVISKSANYNAVAGDIIFATGGASGITITLPSPVQNDKVTVTKIDSGAGFVTVDGNGATVNGKASLDLELQDESFVMYTDGSIWRIV